MGEILQVIAIHVKRELETFRLQSPDDDHTERKRGRVCNICGLTSSGIKMISAVVCFAH